MHKNIFNNLHIIPLRRISVLCLCFRVIKPGINRCRKDKTHGRRRHGEKKAHQPMQQSIAIPIWDLRKGGAPTVEMRTTIQTDNLAMPGIARSRQALRIKESVNWVECSLNCFPHRARSFLILYACVVLSGWFPLFWKGAGGMGIN